MQKPAFPQHLTESAKRKVDSQQQVVSEHAGHAGDCTIYAALVNGRPYDGICTCGYGWQLARNGDRSQMMSEERMLANASTKPKMSDDELADRLMHVLINEMQYKADCFDYLCWLEETHQRENVKEAPFLVRASDETTCWGKSYADCVKVAMKHDKELYDAVQDLVLPGDEHQNGQADRPAGRNSTTV